jgi:hypothetical protein
MKKNSIRLYSAVLLAIGLASAILADEPKPARHQGLSAQKGILVFQGKPYRGIGANYFSMFYRTLKDASGTSYEQGLQQLAQGGVPFVRFMASGFWPIDWDLYFRDKEAYFARFDRVVHAAEKHRIGLIPSLFWYVSTVPDLMGEPLDQLGNRDSKTIAFIRQYTTEVVSRYKDSPAIWGWEFGNEYNLQVDLPNADVSRPPVNPRLKTALKRTQRDDLSFEAMRVALTEFAQTVRAYDKHRILSTGNAVPRPSAYHNSLERSWKKDTKQQFEKVLLRDNPDPFDTISVHIYPQLNRDYPAGVENVGDLVEIIHDLSRRAKKPLFLGEFGVPRTFGKERERSLFETLLTAIEKNEVPLSAFWVFDYSSQEQDWNVTWNNDRAYFLHLLHKANSHVQRTLSETGTK